MHRIVNHALKLMDAAPLQLADCKPWKCRSANEDHGSDDRLLHSPYGLQSRSSHSRQTLELFESLTPECVGFDKVNWPTKQINWFEFNVIVLSIHLSSATRWNRKPDRWFPSDMRVKVPARLPKFGELGTMWHRNSDTQRPCYEEPRSFSIHNFGPPKFAELKQWLGFLHDHRSLRRWVAEKLLSNAFRGPLLCLLPCRWLPLEHLEILGINTNLIEINAQSRQWPFSAVSCRSSSTNSNRMKATRPTASSFSLSQKAL